jgi:hypothetical protein
MRFRLAVVLSCAVAVTTTVAQQWRNPGAPWIVAVAEDERLWQEWSTTSTVSQGNTLGAFSLPVLPGRYLVAALPQPTFDSWVAARRGILRFGSSGSPVDVKAHGSTSVDLTVQRRPD